MIIEGIRWNTCLRRIKNDSPLRNMIFKFKNEDFTDNHITENI